MRSSAKQAMHQSFRTMLKAKPLDRITVRDVVEDCGLTRNTFYYYYEDIYDLFNEYLDAQMREAWQALPENGPWDAALARLLGCVCETPQMARHVFLSRRREVMLQYLRRAVASLLGRQLAQERDRPSEKDLDLICETCSRALCGMMESWLTAPDAPVLQTEMKRLTNCFAGAVRGALQYCAANPRGEDDGETDGNPGFPTDAKGAE